MKQSHLGKYVCWECDSNGYLVRPNNILVKKQISLLRNRPEDMVKRYSDKFWGKRTNPRPYYVSVFYRGKTVGPKVEIFKVKKSSKNGGSVGEFSLEKIRPTRTQKDLCKFATFFQSFHEQGQQEAAQ